jgi:site-specific DNA recombinase
MEAASERGEFDCLIADDSDRLSRNAWMLPKLVAALEYRGQFLLTADGKLDSRDANSTVMVAFQGISGSEDRKKISHRTKRGQRQRFEEGLNTGGKAFGYRSVPLAPGDPDDRRARREADPAQARIVLRVFRAFAAGDSFRTIASALNADGVLAPGADWDRKTRRKDAKWLGSAIRAMLDNDLYRGCVIFNRWEWRRVPGSKRRSARQRPESEWMRREAPELRIVDDLLWQRVRARRATQRARATPITYVRGGRAVRSVSGRPHKYIFSGLLKCAACGSSLVVVDKYRIACSSQINGGDAACAHKRRYDRRKSEQLLLDAIRGKLLTPEREQRFRTKLDTLLSAADRAAEAADPRVRLTALDREIARYCDAIAEGVFSPALAARLAAAETEKAHLLAAPAPPPRRHRVAAAGKVWQATVKELSEALAESPAAARAILERLFSTIPVAANGNARLRLDGGKMVNLAAADDKIELVAGAGFEPATFGL